MAYAVRGIMRLRLRSYAAPRYMLRATSCILRLYYEIPLRCYDIMYVFLLLSLQFPMCCLGVPFLYVHRIVDLCAYL